VWIRAKDFFASPGEQQKVLSVDIFYLSVKLVSKVSTRATAKERRKTRGKGFPLGTYL